MGIPWSCEARQGGKRSRDHLPDRATLNAPGRAPRSAAGTHTCAVVYTPRPLSAPQPRALGTTREQGMQTCKKSDVWYLHINVCCVGFVCGFLFFVVSRPVWSQLLILPGGGLSVIHAFRKSLPRFFRSTFFPPPSNVHVDPFLIPYPRYILLVYA